MQDEAIFLDTVKFIREHTVRISKQFINIRETIWWNFNLSKQDALEATMLEYPLMSFNPNDQNEVELTGQARTYILRGDKQLEKDFLKYIQTQPDIEYFMVNNFIKPNLKSPLTKNETDNGVNFLKELKGKGFIRYTKSDIEHIINWYVDPEKTIKRWFDTVDEDNPVMVYIEDLGKNYLLLSENEHPIAQPKENSPHSVYNIHMQNPTGTVIGDNATQSFKAHNISNTIKSSINPTKTNPIIKWILLTLSGIAAALVTWWLTK